MEKPRSWVIIGGAAGGIGLEVIRQLVPQSLHMAVIVLNQQQGEEAIVAGAHRFVVCDFADTQSVDGALEELDAILQRDRLAAVIQCAAIQPVEAMELTSRRDLEALYAVNVFGTFQLVRGLIPRLRGGGRIVLFSSMAGRVATPMLGAYSSSKHALEALADAMRVELKSSNISVSLIEPGGVATPMAFSQGDLVTYGLESMNEGDRQRYGKLYNSYATMTTKALKRASTPEYVASVAVDAAIQSVRPQARYLVGTDARIMVMLKWLLPTSWLDALFRRLIPA